MTHLSVHALAVDSCMPSIAHAPHRDCSGWLVNYDAASKLPAGPAAP